MTPSENSIPYGICRCCGQSVPPELLEIPLPTDESIRHIPLDKGQYAIVDVEDFVRLSAFKWFACWSRTSRTFYARTGAIRKTKTHTYRGAILLHRMVLEITDPKILIDHKNHQGLDCRKQNLRQCTAHKNGANKQFRKNESGYKGVYPFKGGGTKPWRACIGFNYRFIHIGLFREKEEAAKAYDRKAIELFGEFAHLNFPRSDYDVLLTARTVPD